MNKFIALWQHRINKYSHLLGMYLFFIKDYLTFAFLKITLPKNQQIVALILTKQLGDIVAIEPLIRRIREKYPNEYFVFVCSENFKTIHQNHPAIDLIWVEYCENGRQKLMLSGVFDVIINLQFKENSHCKTCNVFVENSQAEAVNISIFNYFETYNLLEYNTVIAGFKAAKDYDQQPQLHISAFQKKIVDDLKLPQKYIAIHTQSFMDDKDWTPQNWNALIEWIFIASPYHIVEVGLANTIKTQNPKYRNLCKQTSIIETAEVIQRADYFIGLDSGPSHLANAVGTYGFILIGQLKNYHNHRPFSGNYDNGSNATIIRNSEGACSELSFDEVLEEIKIKLG